jgi:bifunctional enzyme CysN/CysC
VVVAVNKMDLVGYSRQVFDAIERDYGEFAQRIGIEHVTCIPLCAVHGDNIVQRATSMPWYSGPTLIQCLEDAPVTEQTSSAPFRMPVQWVNRPDANFRGFAGIIASGVIRVGDGIRVLPSGRQSRVARILVGDREVSDAASGQSVTLTLTEEIDISRGDLISAGAAPPAVADQFEATIVWMHDRPMLQGRSYLLKIGTKTVSATVAPIKYKINVNTHEHVAARRLDLNDIGVCALELSQPVAVDRKTCTGRRSTSTRPRARGSTVNGRASSGSRACPAPANRQSPTSSRRGCSHSGAIRTCWTATTCVMD